MRLGVLLAMLFASLAGLRQAPSLPQRLIEQDIWIPGTPLPDCTVPELAGRVFDALSTIGGLEYLPGRCVTSAPVQASSHSARESLRGLTARGALDRLVEVDPRFAWMEIDGVLVVRPFDAWRDRDHFLNRTVSLAFTEQNLGGALYSFMNAVNPGGFRGRGTPTFSTAEANRPFSLSLGDSTALAALNAIVRAHGGLKWGVGYCQPQRRVEYARVFLHTFDGAGMAGQPAPGQPGDNAAQDPCRSMLRER
jgi:hypothetical protein